MNSGSEAIVVLASEVERSLLAKYPIAAQPPFADAIKTELKRWGRNVSLHAGITNPYRDDKTILETSEREVESARATLSLITKDVDSYRDLVKKGRGYFDEKYWANELKALESSKKRTSASSVLLVRRLAVNNWRKHYDTLVAAWELEFLQEQRNKLMERLSEWMELVNQLSKLLYDLSIEPGLLFDLSKDSLSLSNIETIKRWADYISKDQGVKDLCDMLGRISRAEKSRREEIVLQSTTIHSLVPDINSKEEVVGLRLGNELEYTLPQEIALLADEETSVLFDLKLVEGRLMCFDLQGMMQFEETVNTEIQIQGESEDKRGPIIICIDTSGSMHGTPENVAKAVTLFLATRALQQRRHCYLINFSTGVETLDLSGKMGLSTVIDFLRRSFHGGTDVGPALAHALKMTSTEEYRRSDVLVISDFVIGSVDDTLTAKIKASHGNGNRFFALCIGNVFLSERTESIFAGQWVYDPSNFSVKTLQKLADEITSC